MKISKELFENIYNIKVNRIQIDEFHNVWIDIDSNHLSRFDSVNNSFFKCKDWANKQGYRLLSGSHDYNNKIICYIYKGYDYIGDFDELFVAESEQQAVFDACQWILENKGE